MNPGNDIVKELEELASPLANMPRVMPFAVPENYFNALPQSLMALALQDEQPELSLPKELPYAVPQGYFEGFTTSLMSKLEEEPAFGTIAPPSFEVPAGYFNNLPQQMLAAARAADAPEQKKGRTISFFPLRAVQWAAAAAFILAVGFGGYKMMNNQPQAISAERQLAQLDKELIRSYVVQHIDEFDTELLAESNPHLRISSDKSIRKLKEADIENYLDAEGI